MPREGRFPVNACEYRILGCDVFDNVAKETECVGGKEPRHTRDLLESNVRGVDQRGMQRLLRRRTST